MKALRRVTILTVAMMIAAGGQAVAEPGPLQSLSVTDKPLPVFPYELIKLGVRDGMARIAFSVDATGKIDDILAVAYTHPEFARVTIAALRRWKFEPAVFRGKPIAAATEIQVNFAVEGTVVISLTPNEVASLQMYQILGSRDSYRPYSLKELDRIPVPIAAPSPVTPASFARNGSKGQVTVSFYIDENGRVRMPSVEPSDDPDLAAAAIEAMHNWKFEPPTCKNRPVLVKAVQVFNFRILSKQ